MKIMAFPRFQLLINLVLLVALATMTSAVLSQDAMSENVGVYAFPGDMPSMDPPFMLSGDTSIGFNVYETLTIWDPIAEVVAPVLAESWESNEDGTEWVFNLRAGVTFHDGSPLTANDVKASLDRNIAIGLVAYDFIGLGPIEVIDDLTLRFTAEAPRNVPLILSATFGMFIYKADAAAAPEEWFVSGNDAGTGPYVLTSFEPSVRVIMDYYPDYWGGWEDGQFTTVVYEITEDPTVRDQKIRSGEADITATVPLDSLESLEMTEGLTLLTFSPMSHLVAGFDLSNPPLDNVDVRRALVQTFPYNDVLQGIYLGLGSPSRGFGPSSLWDAPDDFPTNEYNLEAAAALLDSTGMADGFELDLALSTGNKEALEAATLWQSELTKVNIQLNIQELSSGAFWDYAYNPANEDFDIFMVTAGGDVPSPWSWLICYTSSPFGWLPFVGHSNAEFDELVLSAWAAEASDTTAANDYWVAAQRILIEDAASVFVVDPPGIFAHGDDIVGIVPNPPYPSTIFWYQLRREM